MRYYQEKVAVVTGGASGIGRAICEKLGSAGTTLVITDIDFDGACKVAEAVNLSGGNAEAVRLDVTKKEDVDKIVEDAARKYGRIDLMFNNAGIAIVGEVRDMTEDMWERIININLMGIIYGTLAAYSHMVKQGSGHIINTSSQAGLYVVSGSTAYAAAKHGVVGMSKSLRAEGADLGVRVSVICPGPIATNIFNSATVAGMDKDEFFTKLPFNPMPVDKAADYILKKVASNRGIIILPFSARVLWWINRLHPAVGCTIGRFSMNYIRRLLRKD